MRTKSASSESRAPRDFFISYNQADRAWAEWIAWQLEDAGYAAFLQSRDLASGADFVSWMQEAGASATRTIAIISPEYLSSRFTRPEWAQAFARDPTGESGTLLPVRVREVKLTGLLSQVVYIDLVGLDEEEAKIALLKGVRRERAKPEQSPAFPSALRSVHDQPRFPGTVSPVWNVPPRNPNFTGREDILSNLHAALHSELPGMTMLAITGLGGSGKTQLAIEYAYRYSADYDLVWWVSAEQSTSLVADLAGLARTMNLLGRDEPDQRDLVEAVQLWLRLNQRWLLIFDNVEDQQMIRDYLPRSHTGHVIVTSRNSNWPPPAMPLPISGLTLDESVAFLQRRMGTADETEAAVLAEELGNLPLALEQAAAYIVNTNRSISEYLVLFRRQQGELLRRGELSTEYANTVATTWEVSFQEVEKFSPAGADLMRLLAFLAPDDIPKLLIREGADILPSPLAEVVLDEIEYDEAVMALRRYSFVQRTTDALSMHWLVQTMVRDWLGEDERKTWAAAAVQIIDRAFPADTGDVHTGASFAHLLPHALASATYAESLDVVLEVCARLLNRVGGYLVWRGELTKAQSIFERALRISETTLGPDHPSVATALNNVARVLQDLGDLGAARAYFEQALRISETTLGPDHPSVATALNNVARVLQDLGDLGAARAYFEQALRITEATLGTEHPHTAILLSNLARVLYELSDFGAARAYFEQALRITEATLGPKHPVIATLLNNLGLVLKNLGDLGAARAHFEQALRISEATLGPDHPSVATAHNNIAHVLQDLGDLGAARVYLEQALRIDQAIYGPSHLEVATDLGNLAHVLHELGDLSTARVYLERALRISKAILGPDHPRVASYSLLRDHLEETKKQEDAHE